MLLPLLNLLTLNLRESGDLVTPLREGQGCNDLSTCLVINRLYRTLTLTLTPNRRRVAWSTPLAYCVGVGGRALESNVVLP